MYGGVSWEIKDAQRQKSHNIQFSSEVIVAISVYYCILDSEESEDYVLYSELGQQ